MKRYKIIYAFEVIEKLKTNENIYMLDRESATTECVSNMEVGDFASVLAIAEKEKDRFEFWEVLKKEDKNE